MTIAKLHNTNINLCKNESNVAGRCVSISSMSCANKFNILPIGTVSKYFIGLRNTFLNISSCNLFDASKVALVKKYPTPNVVIKTIPIETP